MEEQDKRTREIQVGIIARLRAKIREKDLAIERLKAKLQASTSAKAPKGGVDKRTRK